MDQLASPTDTTLLNVSISAHGLCPKAPNSTSQFLRGDATWAPAAGGAGTNTVAVFDAMDGNPPATNYATFSTRNSGGLAVLQFTTGSPDTTTVFVGVVPQGAVFTTGLTVIIFWASASITGSVVEWQASVDNVNAHSIDTDSYGTAVSQTSTNGTAAVMNNVSILLPNANLQSLAAEQPYKLKITRRGSDTGVDTLAETASLFMVEVKTY